MEYLYCPNCRKMTGHKRALGWGTFFGGIFTLGVSTLTIPFYPKRCIICGRPLGDTQVFAEASNAETLEGDAYQETDTKKCPVCAETIKLEAMKCRFCGEQFNPDDVAKQVAEFKSKDSFVNRIACSDGNCIGIIGPDGKCTDCGKPYKPDND